MSQNSHMQFQHHHDEILEFAPNYDSNAGYMDTSKEDLPHWSKFNHNITSSEPDVKSVLKMLRDCGKNELFDLRPYMIVEPVKLDQYSLLGEALQLFRLHHMRHLLVVSPLDCSLQGIITRKDLHVFMNY